MTSRFNMISVYAACVVLIGCGGGGGGGPLTFPAATAGADIFAISTDITGSPNSVIDGAGGSDELRLESGAVVGRVAFSTAAPTGGAVNLQNIETITIDGGRVNGSIDASDATAPITFNLMSGEISGQTELSRRGALLLFGVLGSDFADTFNLTSGTVNGNMFSGDGNDVFIIAGNTTTSALTIRGVIDGAGGSDELRLNSGGIAASIGIVSITFVDARPPSGELFLLNVETITIDGGTVTGSISGANSGTTFNLMSGIIGGSISGSISGGIGADVFNLTGGTISGIIFGSVGNDTFIIAGDITGSDLTISRPINGGGGINGGSDELRVVSSGVVASIAVSGATPTGGVLHLQNIETITIDGGTVVGGIAAWTAHTGVTFNLISGSVGENIIGSSFNDTFILGADITSGGISIGGFISGGAGNDVLRYEGAPMGTAFTGARNGLDADRSIRDGLGDIRSIESQRGAPPPSTSTNSLHGLSVRGIEVLGLSPALNLYGAMSDALMQFGQQTAQGFALADLDLSTGRATSLVSKDSPFTKGRIWAHKITHSGNGKGSIGLGLTGLTARADSDYDYEMSLTQHGFDAPLAATRLGAFNLRAVSHTMTGVIETNVAEANVSGYGAGVALLWNSGAVARQRAKRARAPIISAVSASAHHHHHGLSAHITSLAGAYEVEAHTSPLNPRAIVNEVSEGSFSAINAVVSVGVADTRKLGHSLVLRTTADIVWQTLSLDDFTETGSGGIAINFDKATRFTARVGAGLESEHWFSDVAFVHETSSGGTLSSGLRQDYKQDDGTAIEMKFGGKLADLATGLTLKAYAGLRTSLISSDAIDPSAHLALNWRF